MTYPFAYKTRLIAPETHTFEFEKTYTATTSNTLVIPGNLPPGAHGIVIAVAVTGTDQSVVITTAPYVDRAQSIVGGAYNYLETGTTATTSTITLAGTSALTGGVYGVVAAGDQYGLAVPVISPYGDQFTITSTATTGTLYFGVMAVEV